MKFSQRKGLTPILDELQINSVNETLRNQLWNVIYLAFFSDGKQKSLIKLEGTNAVHELGIFIYINYFKKPIDKLPNEFKKIILELRDYFFACKWFEVYDFLEQLIDYTKQKDYLRRFEGMLNIVLEQELSTYRFIDGVCTNITSQNEIDEIREVIENGNFEGAQNHIKRALELLYDREKPDYRNSIKESISAVESAARSITHKPKATLGDLLPYLEKQNNLHPALKEAFSKLYGYTSDEGGIRHAMMDSPALKSSDAKFFIISCSAFINYLKAAL